MTTENQQNRVAIITVTAILLFFFIGCAIVGVTLGPAASNKFHDGEIVTLKIDGERGQIVYSYAGSYDVRLPSLAVKHFNERELEAKP